MYCQRCGAKLPENTSGCPLCGAEYRVENTTPIINDKKVPQKNFFTKKKITITAIIAVILIVGGIVAAITSINGSSISISTTDTLQLADRYLKEMNYEQAIVEIQKVLEIEPKNVDAYIELAEIYFGLGDMDKAIEVLERGYENTDSEEIENKIRKIIYADLQDKAKIISNICNMCLSDFFMAGYDDFCKTTITGEKTNGSLLKIKVDDKDELDDSLDESYKFFISNLTNNLDMLLPNDCWFSIEVAHVGVVKGVIYTITNPVELLPPVGYEAEVYKVKGFDSAYKLTDKDGIDIGVCGSYIR